MLASFKLKDYNHLRELGTVVDPGLSTAEFIPARTIVLPVKSIVALELMRLYSTARVSKDGGKKVDKIAKAALALGVARTTLRKLGDRVPKRPAAVARLLDTHFPEPQGHPPVRGPPSHAPNAASSATPHRPAPVPDDSRQVRGLKRRICVLEFEKTELQDGNARLRQRVEVLSVALVKEKQQSARHAAAASRESLRLVRRIVALEAGNAACSEVQVRELARARDKLEKERARALAGEVRADQLRASVGFRSLARSEEEVRRLRTSDAALLRRIDSLELERQAAAAAARQAAAALEVERRNVADLEHEVVVTRKQTASTFKRAYWAQALTEQAQGKLSPTKRAIAAAVLSGARAGAEVRLPQPNLRRSGPGITATKLVKARVGSLDLSERQERRRVQVVTPLLDLVSGGGEHTVKLIADHAKANPQL